MHLPFSQDAPLDLVLVWTQIDNGCFAGRNNLVKLAIRILSVIANSAGCERAFSDFGIIHTKPRNKLSAEKVHKTGVLKMDIRRTHVEAGLTRPRQKRAFGEIDESEEPPEVAVPHDVNSEFHDLAHQLIQAVERADSDEAETNNDNVIPSICIPPLPRPVNHQSTPIRPPSQPIPLKSLFDYPQTAEVTSGTSLEFYWKGGLKNLERELVAYDLLYEEESDEGLAVPTGAEGTT
jgi:hypothetical protein